MYFHNTKKEAIASTHMKGLISSYKSQQLYALTCNTKLIDSEYETFTGSFSLLS